MENWYQKRGSDIDIFDRMWKKDIKKAVLIPAFSFGKRESDIKNGEMVSINRPYLCIYMGVLGARP